MQWNKIAREQCKRELEWKEQKTINKNKKKKQWNSFFLTNTN